MFYNKVRFLLRNVSYFCFKNWPGPHLGNLLELHLVQNSTVQNSTVQYRTVQYKAPGASVP